MNLKREVCKILREKKISDIPNIHHAIDNCLISSYLKLTSSLLKSFTNGY